MAYSVMAANTDVMRKDTSTLLLFSEVGITVCLQMCVSVVVSLSVSRCVLGVHAHGRYVANINLRSDPVGPQGWHLLSFCLS